MVMSGSLQSDDVGPVQFYFVFEGVAKELL